MLDTQTLSYPLERLADPPYAVESTGRLVQVIGEGGAELQSVPHVAPEDLHSMYRWMVRVRVFDTRLVSLQRQGRLGFFVPSTGEEALQIGTAWALQPEDWIFPAYREQGVALYRGYPMERLLCQFLGNREDYLKGRQMPNHYGSPRFRMAVASSPVGTQMPQAVGAAWSAKLRGEPSVTVCYFGDGSTSTGDFHAGMTLAALQQVPVVFFCKNNGWAISLPYEKQTRAAFLSDKAIGYGMPAIRVDGNDVLAVYEASREAMTRAREGEGPTFVELVTQRMGPHSTSDDPSRYRDPALLEPWKAKDPIKRFREYLEGRNLWTEDDEERAWTEADARVTEAIQWAEPIPQPSPASIYDDVYAEMPWHLREQRDESLQ